LTEKADMKQMEPAFGVTKHACMAFDAHTKAKLMALAFLWSPEFLDLAA
jgi:hypothetical protein